MQIVEIWHKNRSSVAMESYQLKIFTVSSDAAWPTEYFQLFPILYKGYYLSNMRCNIDGCKMAT